MSLDQLDGRLVSVTADGPAAVGDRFAVEYDPDGGADVGRVAGSDRDLRDGCTLPAVTLVVGVLSATVAPWPRRTDRDPSRQGPGQPTLSVVRTGPDSSRRPGSGRCGRR